MSFNENNQNGKKSPIKDKPSRLPGQSLNEEMQRIYDDEIGLNITLLATYLFILIFLWLNKLTNCFQTYYSLTTFSLVTIGFGVYLFLKIKKSKQKIRSIKQGIAGELYVGQYLTECLLKKGYNILHDIPVELANNTKFNIDHVIISPNGIFTVETKTISKPVKGKTEIYFDGENIIINGQVQTDKPVIQAKAEASWLKEFISKTTGKDIAVRPVIIYPGWYILPESKKSDVWILNEKSISRFIDNEVNELDTETIKSITYKLAEFCNK